MDPKQHSYAPQEVEALSGVPRDSQRDWRRRELIHGWGRQAGTSRWKYSFEEVVAFYLTDRLSNTGMDLQIATALGAHNGPALMRLLQGHPAGRRYVAVVCRTKPVDSPRDPLIDEISGEPGIMYADSLAEWDGMEFDWLEVIDLKYIASSAPRVLRDEAQEYGSG